MGLTNCTTQIWVSSTSGVSKPYNLYINKFIILRLLQGVYNHLFNKVENFTNPWCFNLVATLYETRLLQPKFFHMDLPEKFILGQKFSAVASTILLYLENFLSPWFDLRFAEAVLHLLNFKPLYTAFVYFIICLT